MPEFPPIARAAKVLSKPLELDVIVDANGLPVDLKLTNASPDGKEQNDPNPMYFAAATNAIKQWRFPAEVVNSSRRVHLRVTYHLDDPGAKEMMKGCATSRVVINLPDIDVWAAPLISSELDSYQPSVGRKK